MINKLQILAIFIIIPLIVVYMYADSKGLTINEIFLPGTPTMHIGEIPLRVEIANTDAERVQGLSKRNNLSGANGLLFVFPKEGYHGMWMKDMKFSIDIIWIDASLKVISIDKNVGPDTYPKVFKPTRPALYAVETEVHFSDTFGIREGHDVRLPLEYLED
jgi:uncharacterized membrane protein (UPF0127 family)